MHMLTEERGTNDLVARQPHNLVVELRIRAGKSRIAGISIDRRPAMLHVSRNLLELCQRFWSHVERRQARALRLQQQAKGIEVLKLLARPLGRGAIADEVLL